jgi:hypothetical protein
MGLKTQALKRMQAKKVRQLNALRPKRQGCDKKQPINNQQVFDDRRNSIKHYFNFDSM